MGEAEFGLTDGVLATKPGWIGRVEVVEVTYDPAKITFEKLLAKGESCGIANRVFSRTDRDHARAKKLAGKRAVQSTDPIRVQDDKYYLSRTPLKYVPMTPMQAMRINAKIGKRQNVAALLSPRQQKLLEQVKATPKAGWVNVIGQDLRTAWTTQAAVREKMDRK